MADTDKKIDPYDVEALEKSLNDSATRVSTIWVSFLIFSLYLLTATATVTHRQLFLGEPVKLPVLNIDLPLWVFFFLAPLLFLIFHAYVLIQLVLLSRTASFYTAAIGRVVDRNNMTSRADASLRQRLANTLFAQLFAGSASERDGWFGAILKAIAWATLAIAPILILLTMQLSFLPYHSYFSTWIHRTIVLLDLIAIVCLWPLGPKTVRTRIVSTFIVAAILILVLTFSAVFLTFPGEWHAKWTRFTTDEQMFPDSPDDTSPARTLPSLDDCRYRSPLSRAVRTFDRLHLPYVDVVDDDKLAKFEQATEAKELRPDQGERTQSLRDRNFDCGTFTGADLRRVDFTGATLNGAIFWDAELQGANLARVTAQAASFEFARLEGANLEHAWLPNANFAGARLKLAKLTAASLQGANFFIAQLQSSDLYRANLQGATLVDASLQDAMLLATDLRGTSFNYARLHGAILDTAKLQGADFSGAVLIGASFNNISKSDAMLTNFAGSYLWRAPRLECDKAQVREPRFDAIVDVQIDPGGNESELAATPEEIANFVERSIRGLPKKRVEEVRKSLHEALNKPLNEGELKATQDAWKACADSALDDATYEEKLVKYLADLACSTEVIGNSFASALIQNWTSHSTQSTAASGERRARAFVQVLLQPDMRDCLATADLDLRVSGGAGID